jgi:hypothetical protein
MCTKNVKTSSSYKILTLSLCICSHVADYQMKYKSTDRNAPRLFL